MNNRQSSRDTARPPQAESSRRGATSPRYGRRTIRSGFTPLVRELSVAFVLTFGVGAPFAWAAPQGGQVVAGAAGIARNGPLTTIQQQSQRAIVNWQSFGVNAGETVRFAQPATNAAILNRVTGALPSNINGLVQGNGKVFLVNPNGIVVGANGVINVQGGFVASTQNLSDTAFMQGGALTLSGGTDGSIQILGKISAPDGDITIVAPKVAVGSGAALEAGRAVQLIAASTVTLSNGQFTVIPQAGDAGELTVDGVVSAANAQLAAANNNLGALAINTSGTVRATGTQTNPDGSVSIVAQGAGGNVKVGGTVAARHADGTGGSIVVSGANVSATGATLDASGTQGGTVSIAADTAQGTALVTDSRISATGDSAAGGLIGITGWHTGLMGQTTVDASGASAGGTVLVGGGMHGQDSRIANATATTIGSNVVLRADGTQGNASGGEVVAWSNDTTRFAGTIGATGSGTGHGGNAEVSGAGTLDYRGFADLAGGALGGAFGTLLLDPTDVTIQAAGPDSGATWSSGTADFSSSGGTSVITTATLQSQLAAASVTIDSHSGTGGNGDITVNDAIVIPNARSLTLNAARDINLNADVTTNSTGSLSAFAAYAARDINVNTANIGGTSGVSNVVLMSGQTSAPTTATPTVAFGTVAPGAGQVNFNFAGGTNLQATQNVIVVTGCSTACSLSSTDTALTTSGTSTYLSSAPDLSINGGAGANHVNVSGGGAMYFGGFRDISVDGAVSGFVASGNAGGITGGTSMASSLVPGALFWDGIGLYALRDLTVNAPITPGDFFESVQLKSERDINLNADITSTYVLAANAARNINVTASTLEGGAGYTLGKTLPAGVYLLAGQRALTSTDNALAATVNDGYGGYSSNIGSIYFNRTSSPTLLKSDTDLVAISGCTTTTNCVPSQRTDFLPANVLLESSAGTSGPVAGSIYVGGFHNMTPERWDPVAGAIAGTLSASGDISFNAFGNLTLNETTLTAGNSLQLLAAGGNYDDPTPISGSTLADYAGIVYFTQPNILLTATDYVDIRSGTDGTGTSLGATGGTMPGGGAYTTGRTNQARPYFNSVSNPNQVVIRYGSSANALNGALTIDGFLNTVLTLQNNDGSAATNLTTNGINIVSYGDVVIPQHYIRALNGAWVDIEAGGNGANGNFSRGLVGQVKLTDASPVVQGGAVFLESSSDATGRHLDFAGGTGSLTSGYGTGGPILLQYDPGLTSFALLEVTGFKNTPIYVFSGSATPTLAGFDPNVSLSFDSGRGNFWSNVTAFGNVTFENNKLTGMGNGTGGVFDYVSLNVVAGQGGAADSGGVLQFAQPTTISGGFNRLILSNNAAGLSTVAGQDLTNVTFGPIGIIPTSPLTASIDGTTTTLGVPVTDTVDGINVFGQGFALLGFRNVDLNSTGNAPLSFRNLTIAPNGNSQQGDININEDIYVRGALTLYGSSINTGSNIIGSLAPAGESYSPSFTATGLATAWGGTAKNSTINTSSKDNVFSTGMQLSNVAAGTTMTINDRDTVIISSFGASTDQGNIVVNAQGDIGINGSIARTGATNPASFTFNAGKDLSSIFSGYDAYNQGTVSSLVQEENLDGGKGAGVTFFLAPVERVVPIYTPVGVLSLQSTNPGGTDYVAPSDPGWNATHTQYTISSSSPSDLLKFFAVGTVVTPGQVVVSNAVWFFDQAYVKSTLNNGAQVYVVTGYTTSTAPQTQFTSLGFGVNTLSNTVNNGGTGGTVTTTLNRTSFAVSGDNPVVDALVTPAGDPVAGTYALGLGQQFYVAAGGNATYPDASWDVRVTGPVTVQTQLGNIIIKSGSTYADTYQGFHTMGDTADVHLSSNVPPAGQGLGHPANLQENLVTQTVNGNILIGGYRDIVVQNAGTVQPTGTGSISLIAGRDLLLNDNIGATGATGTLTLGAGNMIEQAAGKTITANNLVLVTGRGTDNLNTDVNNLAGYLQMPSAAYTGALAGGTTATGTIEVTNDKALNIVSNIPVNPVTGAVTFTTNGPVFADPTVTPLQPVGLTTSTLGGPIAGSVELTTTSGDINVAAPVTTTNTGGEINIRSDAGNVALGANVTTTGNAFIEANQAITDTAGTLTANAAVLTAGTTIGTAANPVNTAVNTLALVAGGNVYDTNAGALTVAGQTTNNGSLNVQSTGGTMTVGSVSLAPTILNNAPGATITGINASGSGAVNLTATGTTSDIVFDATARSGTGTVTATAGENIVNGMAALVPGANGSGSSNLDVATAGNVVLNAGNTIGGDGASTIDPVSVWSGGNISATSAGTTGAAGTYLAVLDTTGAVNVGGSSVSINSGKNIDVTAVTSTTAGTGNLAVTGPVAAQNAGYVRLAADRNVAVQSAVSTTGTGDVVVTAGLGGTGSVTQTAGGTLSTGTGEINVKAANGITFGANATTGGNIVVQAGDAIAQAGGTLAASGVALEAGTTIGMAANRINTATNTLAMTSTGSEYVSNTGDLTLGAKTTGNGTIDVTNAGVLTVGSASVLTGIAVPGLTGGITTVAPGVAVTGVTANGSGNVNLAATGATGDIVTTQPVSSGTGNIAMTAARNVTDTATGSVSTGGSGTIGVTAQTGSITMADGASYTTAGGNITATAATNIALAQATTGSNTVGTVTLTAANGAISNNRTAGANNVTTGTLNATAATGIGSGTLDSSTALTTDIATLGTKVTGAGDVVIDNTNASLLTLGNGTLTNSAANGNVRVATAGAVTTGNSVSASNTVQLVAGDVKGTLANDVGAVTLANNVTANTLDVNAGGLVQQTGGTLNAATTLVDATRYTSGSDATLTNGSGTLTENGSSVTGNYTITTAGTLNQTGNTTVGGNLTESGYTGGTVSGTVTVGGNYNGVNTFSGSGSVTTGGSNSTINANSATTGVVVASGAGPNFDLSSANLGNSTNITVDLRGQSATVTGNTPSILLNGATGGSNSLGTVTVKTAKPVTVAVTQQDYNLTQSAAIDIGAHTLTVNAVAGSASSASLQASPGTLTLPGQSTPIDYNAANNTLNGGNGSRIVLNNTGNAIGGLTILNGESANVVTSGNLALGNVTVNNGLSATSTTGAITQTAGTSVVARTLALNAVNGIGTAATPIAFNTVAATAAGVTPVLATSDGSGSTSVATTGQVQLGGQVYQPTDTSSTTAATLTSAANGTTGGDLTVLAAGPVTTGATVTTGGNGAIDVGTTAGSITLSNMVTAGGSGSIELTAATGIAVNAAVSSTSGEINALAQGGDVALGANVSTTGNAFVQASGAITQSAGTLTADGAVLAAGTTIGSSANAIDTSVNTLALVSAGDAYASNDKALTAAAQTSANGNVGITTTSGDLTAGSVSLTPGVVNNAVGANLSGVSANGTGNVTLTAAGTGSNVVLDQSVTSGSGTVTASATQDIVFENAAQIVTTGAAVLAAGDNITNATDNTAVQIQAASATLTAGTNIGSGVIDNGITGSTNASELHLNVASLQANAGGDATLWNQGATLLQTSGAGGYFGLNGGGPIAQASGATLSAGSAEFDTTRDTSVGQVSLQNQGDLSIAAANYVGGDYTATSQSGNVTLASGAALNVNGNVTLSSGAGKTVSADPTHIASSGNVVQNGTTTNVGGAMTPLVTIDPVTKTALVSAQGAGADFVLTPALVAQLNAAGVTTVTVDLGNTVTSYSVASLAGGAITVANANNAVTGGWTVRTGPSAIATPTQQQRDYNLTDTAGPVDLGTANLIVNAARGTDFASGSTPSTVAAVNDAANTAAGFNAAQGSNVTLTQTRTASVDVRDAYNVSVTSPGNLNVSYVKANNNASLLAGTASSGNLNINGPVNVGADLIGVGGKDVTIASGAAVAANGKVTLVADETAGTSSGPGWFINRGSIASGSRQVAIYGVSGVAPDGYTAPASQVILGNIDGLSAGTSVDNWATAYDNTSNGALYAAGTGKFNGVQVWYKAPLTKVAAAKPDAGPAVPQTTDTVSNTERDWHVRDAEPPIISAGFSARADCGRGTYAGGGKFTQAGGVEYDIGVPTFMNTATRQFGVVRGARRSEAAAGAMNGDCAEGMVTAALHPERFTISADALFAFDKSSTSDMLAAGRAALERFAAGLRDAYESVTSITVTGYTDRLGSDSYNQRLSEARAETVRAYLAAHGVQAGKMKVLGLGRREPVTHDCPAGHTPEVIACLQPDRRVTIDVVGQKRGAGQAPVLKASEPAGGRDLELSSLD